MAQIVRAIENLKLNHGEPSYRHEPGSNPPIKALRQSHCSAIKEETIVINPDWVDSQAFRLSHDIQVISNLFIMFTYIFEVITKIRFLPWLNLRLSLALTMLRCRIYGTTESVMVAYTHKYAKV